MAALISGSFITFIVSVINGKGGIASKASRIVLTLLALPLIVVVSHFPQALLEHPRVDPRTFMGIGAILTLSCLQVYSFFDRNCSGNSGWKKVMMLLPICFLSYGLFVFSFSFARANSSQKDYESFQLTILGADAQVVLLSGKANSIGFIGSVGKSPLLQNTMRKFPLMERLVPVHINHGWFWGHMQLRAMGIPVNYIEVSDKDRASIGNEEPVVDRLVYTMYVHDGKIIVRFKR